MSVGGQSVGRRDLVWYWVSVGSWEQKGRVVVIVYDGRRGRRKGRRERNVVWYGRVGKRRRKGRRKGERRRKGRRKRERRRKSRRKRERRRKGRRKREAAWCGRVGKRE